MTINPNNGVSESLRQEVLDYLDQNRELIAETSLELGNTFAPLGYEKAVADGVSDWYARHNISAELQLVAPERPNVIARLAGSGRGKSLIFNAHLDTELSGPEYDQLMGWMDHNKRGGWREGDKLFGHTILNDRGLMSVFMVAGKALKDLNVPLAGDVILTSVIGETGQAPVDEYQGTTYEGKGYGSRFLVDHGVRADYALVAEATNFGMSWVECGACYIKITLRGRNMYTPRMSRPENGAITEHPNAIVKAAGVINALETWAVDYEQRNTYESPCGIVTPKAQIGAVRGGIPYRPNRSAPLTKLYIDVRTVPNTDLNAVVDEVREVVQAVIPDAEVEGFMTKAGYEGQGVEPLAEAVTQAYHRVKGGTPPPVDVAITSMWRDTNIFNSAGIPSLTFGNGRGKAQVQGTGHFELDDMVACAKMYALTAINICG